jgi:hypothetical protein
MKIISILFGYLQWHYSKAIFSLTKIWGNFLYFIFELFSIKLLLKNFFSPWKRMSDNYPKNFDLKIYFFTFITNFIVRVIGIIMRTFLLIIGLLSYILLLILYPIILIIWLVSPFLIIGLIYKGLTLIMFHRNLK